MGTGRRIASILLLFLGTAVLAPTDAGASCLADPRTLKQVVRDSKVVFVGTVTSVSNHDRWAVVRIDEVWKGPELPAEVEVRGGPESETVFTSGNRTFRAGVRYLLFPLGEASPFGDNSCSHTTEWRDDLAAARPSAALPKTGVSNIAVWLAAGMLSLGVGLALVRALRNGDVAGR
jgi:LPXTG-motif cell wall-anchored protein